MNKEYEIKKIISGETKFISSDHPYINDIAFLTMLQSAYSDIGYYEVASIIKDRIVILSANETVQKSLDNLNNKIQLSKTQKSKDESQDK